MDAPSHQNNPQERKGKGKCKGKGQGRSKINIEKIENDTKLQVTFSKRRAGLFKKASELDTLCGSKSAVIAFSPSQKAYSYGNPDVETITGMFLNRVDGRNHRIEGFNHGHNDAITNYFSQEITNLEAQVELEKKELKKMREEIHSRNGGAPNLDELDYQQLNELKKSVLNFKQNLEAKVQNTIDQSWIEGGNVFTSGYVGDHYGSNYSHVSFPDNNYPAGSFFSEMTTSDTGYVDPFVPMNNNLGLPFQNPHVAGGWNPIDAQTMNTDIGAEDPLFSWCYAEGNTQGFPSNHGGSGFH